MSSIVPAGKPGRASPILAWKPVRRARGSCGENGHLPRLPPRPCPRRNRFGRMASTATSSSRTERAQKEAESSCASCRSYPRLSQQDQRWSEVVIQIGGGPALAEIRRGARQLGREGSGPRWRRIQPCRHNEHSTAGSNPAHGRRGIGSRCGRSRGTEDGRVSRRRGPDERRRSPLAWQPERAPDRP